MTPHPKDESRFDFSDLAVANGFVSRVAPDRQKILSKSAENQIIF